MRMCDKVAKGKGNIGIILDWIEGGGVAGGGSREVIGQGSMGEVKKLLGDMYSIDPLNPPPPKYPV